SLPPDKRRRLVERLGILEPGEALSLAASLSASFRSGELSVEAYLGMIRPIAAQAPWDAALAPLDDLRFLLRHGLPPDADAETRRRARGTVADLYRSRLEFGGGIANPPVGL